MFEVDNPVEISAVEPDWSRETCHTFWDPGRQLLKTIRQYQKWKTRKGIIPLMASRFYVFWHRFWSVASGADIPLNCRLGGGLVLPHPTGVVIHPQAIIGPNCLIFQQVTITEGVIIGGHVDIGTGAKLIRPAQIGNHAKIGANAVVLCDVPEGATAVGIPARIVPPIQESIDAVSLEKIGKPALGERSAAETVFQNR